MEDDPTRRRGGGNPGGDRIRGDKVAGSKIASQVNTEGGAAFLRAVTAQTIVGRDQITNVYQALPIVWPKASEQEFLKRVQQDFTALVRVRTTRPSRGKSWDASFVQPLLSSRRYSLPTASHNEPITITETGTWQQVVCNYPQIGILVGDPHDGKSLLMRWIAADLARRAVDEPTPRARHVPVFLTVSRFPFADMNGLLDMAAFTSGQQPETMRRLWSDAERWICLLIDDSDLMPRSERDAFLQALADLAATRRGVHSLIISCRPGSGADAMITKLTERFGSVAGFTQWVMLPLDDERMMLLLGRYGAEPWLKTMARNDERLRWLVRRPGVLADLVRATQGLSLMQPPQNLAQLYELFVDGHLFSADGRDAGDAQSRYHYRRVKQQLLSYLAFRMLASQPQNSLVIDDALCKDVALRLESLAQAFSRTRRYMPDDWNATDALTELFTSPVVNRDAAAADRFEFDSQVYRDYYAALYLRDSGEGWRTACQTIRQSGLEGWTDVLILLSGMPPNDTTNALFDEILADSPELAADLWLEKGTVGFNRVPACVGRHFNLLQRRMALPDRLEHPVHPAVKYFRGVTRDARPQVALQAVNGLMQMGVDAIDPLLDVIEVATHPLVIASAIHALFQMGQCAVDSEPEATPLVVASRSGFVFNNLGTCNATIGDLQLVNVPRTCQAEISAVFEDIDFDLFEVPSRFELWCKPAAWFAIDYFRQVRRVDWIGLAAASRGIVQCAGLIIGKARLRGSVQPLVDEMTQHAISYDVLGACISRDLGLGWAPINAAEIPQELVMEAESIYRELRLLFNRTNRSRMLGRVADLQAASSAPGSIPGWMVKSEVGEVGAAVTSFELPELCVDQGRTKSPTDWPDVPDVSFVGAALSVDRLTETGAFGGIRIGRLVPAAFRAAESVTVDGRMVLRECCGGVVEGIRIDELPRWNGVRLKLHLRIEHLRSGRVVGIAARAPANAVQPPVEGVEAAPVAPHA